MKKILIACLTLLAPAVHAYQIVYDNNGSVLGIGNLNVDGTYYNVDFEAGTHSTFGGAEFYFGSESDAIAAAEAVNAVLNANGTPTVNGGSEWYTVLVGGPPYHSAVYNNGTDSYDWYYVNVGPEYESPMGLRTAWSVSAVPIPAAAYLFGASLAALGFSRQKVKAR